MQTFDMFLFRLIWGQGSKYIKIVSPFWIFWKDETCLNSEVDWDVVCLQRVWQISRYVRLRCQDCWRNSTWQTNLSEEKLVRQYIYTYTVQYIYVYIYIVIVIILPAPFKQTIKAVRSIAINTYSYFRYFLFHLCRSCWPCVRSVNCLHLSMAVPRT